MGICSFSFSGFLFLSVYSASFCLSWSKQTFSFIPWVSEIKMRNCIKRYCCQYSQFNQYMSLVCKNLKNFIGQSEQWYYPPHSSWRKCQSSIIKYVDWGKWIFKLFVSSRLTVTFSPRAWVRLWKPAPAEYGLCSLSPKCSGKLREGTRSPAFEKEGIYFEKGGNLQRQLILWKFPLLLRSLILLSITSI